MFYRQAYINSLSTLNVYLLSKDTSGLSDWELYNDWLQTTKASIASISEACEILEYISYSRELTLAALVVAAETDCIPSIEKANDVTEKGKKDVRIIRSIF